MPVIRMWGAKRSGVNVKAARTKVNSRLARLEMEPCLKKKEKERWLPVQFS